jgi:hypothetical protein
MHNFSAEITESWINQDKMFTLRTIYSLGYKKSLSVLTSKGNDNLSRGTEVFFNLFMLCVYSCTWPTSLGQEYALDSCKPKVD